MKRLGRLLAGTALITAILITLAGPALAHPLGNFTSNTFTRLRIQPQQIALDYVLDLAEIPALQAIQKIDADDSGNVDDAEGVQYADRRCGELAEGLSVHVAETPSALQVQAASVTFPQGQAGLQTLRLECDLSTSPLEMSAGTQVRFTDENLIDRVGWREVVAVGEGRSLRTSDVATASVSDELRTYPQDQLSSPLDLTSAFLQLGDVAAADDAASTASPATGALGWLERLTTSFTDAVASRELTPVFALFAGLLAIFLGALHALAPGHGKTVMAAYLVGREGTAREALLLGATVAVTHTFGVLLLGIIVSASQALAPERLYPVLGAASGLLFAVVGLTLLRQAVANRRDGAQHGHGHGHGHGHSHSHDAHAHGPAVGVGHHDAPPRRRGVGWRSLVLPGLAGGLVPTPSALVVLLGGIAIGRTWFGIALVVGYGIGMAATLVAAGYLLLRARAGLQRRSSGTSGRILALTANLPVITAVLITLGGVAIVARSVAVA